MKITLQADLPFSALRLGRAPDGSVSYDLAALRRVMATGGMNPEAMTDDQISEVIVLWYAAARQAGQPQDPIAEDLISETVAENVAGQHYSLPGGRA